MSNFLALDFGDRRIGVARASSIARLPSPLTTLENGEELWDELGAIIKSEDIGCIIIGLPRNLSGDDTDQTRAARDFAAKVEARYTIPIVLQDEALTSQQAEAELAQTGRVGDKGAIDALAATYILEDYFHQH